MFSDFTFHVTSTSGETEVFPIVSDLVFREQEDNDIRLYVRELTTQLLFSGSSYNYFYENWEVSGLCEELPFEIRYQGEAYYSGILKLGTSNLSWDLDKCRMTCSISPSGDYTCLSDNWDDEFNLLQGYTKRSVDAGLGTISYDTCTSSNVPLDPFGYVSGCLTSAEYWSVVQHTAESTDMGSTYDKETEWAQERVTVACVSGNPVAPPGDGWVLWQDNCPTDAVYARAPITTPSSTDDTDIEFYEEINAIVGADLPTIDNGVFLNDVLSGENPCSGAVISDFFSLNGDDTFPSGDVYDEAQTNLGNVIVFQKSDVKRPDVSNNASFGPTTYRTLLDQLRTQFNVEWRFTSGGDLRIEHVSYWDAEQGLDLTTATYSPYIAGTRRYEYTRDDTAKRERFQFMENTSYGFTGTPIVYDCAGDNAQDEIIRDIEKTNNDVDFIYNNADSVSDEGFVFVAAYELSGDYYFMEHDNPLSQIGQRQLNGFMAIPNLLDVFHRHERPQPTGELNFTQTTFESSVPRKQQIEVRVKYSRENFRDLDASKLIKTGLGWGKVKELEYSAKSCTLKLTLLYE